MKIFSWMQSKLNGKPETKTPITNSSHTSLKEEFSDWPQSLLSIGTFGTTTLRSDPEQSQPAAPEQDLISYLDTQEDDEEGSDPGFENRETAGRRNDILVDHKNNTNVIRKKSLTFLLKKIFTSRNRLNLVTDSLPSPTIDKSRMEKILRAVLNKKIHPQTCTTKPTPNKYLVTNDTALDDDSDDDDDDDKRGSTWVKTDSEYIVLEI